MSFTKITGVEYSEDLRRRLEEPERIWLKQVRNLLLPSLYVGVTMLDIGCATGYAYNSFERFGVTYTGLDAEEEYLKIARDWFVNIRSDVSVKFIHHDISLYKIPTAARIVICSATLEHCPNLMPALRNIVDATSGILVLRTFLGDIESIYSVPSPIARYKKKHRKYYNQYSFKDVLGYLEGKGFKTLVYCDEYTDSMPRYLDGVVRTFYIVYATFCPRVRGREEKSKEKND